ncbi:MAG TPA: PAS domain S-box protein [Thermoanaerobaculia bacterium]
MDKPADLLVSDGTRRSREEMLADAQRLSHLGTFERNYKTGEEVWSDEIYRIFELDRSVKRDFIILIGMTHPDDRAEVEIARKRAVESGEPFEQVTRIIVPSGRQKFVRVTGHVVREGGEAVRLVAAVQDITGQKETEAEIRAAAKTKSALATLGQVALSNATLGFLFAQVGEIVRDILESDYCDVYKQLDAGQLLLVGGAGRSEGAVGSAQADGGRKSQAGYTMQVGDPVIVSDLRNETRFTPSELMLQEGIMSGLTVIIDAGGAKPWGVLGAHSRRRQEFSESDVDFLRALATILGQAIERRRAEVELRVRAAQQSAIAEIGQRVLTSGAGRETLTRACELLMAALGVEFAQYLQCDDSCDSLHFYAGHCWIVPPDPIPLHASQGGLAVTTEQPVIVLDYQKETRFDVEPFFTSHGIRSGLAVPVIGPNRKYGAFTVQTRVAKRFEAADVHFMQSMAALLADAFARETADRELIESEQRFRSVVEGASEVIFTMSVEGKLSSLNPAFEVITGWRCEDWIGRRFDALIVPEYLRATEELFASIIREPRPVRLETYVKGKQRGDIVLAIAVSPKIERGVIVELYGFARDVTEERRFETERNRLTRELQLILESTDQGIYATDVEGRCTLINRSAAQLLGASRDWLIGRDMHALIHPNAGGTPDGFADDCAIMNVVRIARSHSSRDDIFCRADGTPFPVEYTASPIIDSGEVKGAVVAFSDISARRRLESKLEQANRLSSLGRLAATVAHEFNNVLMGIAPFAEVLRRESMSDRGNTAVEQISRSVKRGKRITEDILRFTQPSEPALATFDAAGWLSTLALEARSLIGPKYTIDVDVPHEPLGIVGDAGQMHQSFINLILNARDAMPSGGRITMRLMTHSGRSHFDFAAIENPERFAHFIVEDEGHGMSAETLRHIFEPLFTTKKNGTGLGLSVARHVISRHGGEIFVESTIGQGTRFHLFIPLAEAEVVAAAAPPAKTASAKPRRFQRLLLVEDERPVATGLAALLEIEGIDVWIVENGRDVMPAIEQSKPDAVILDIGLPDIDGTKVFASIARAYPDLPVVFSSGHADESKLEAHLSKPHVSFLLKPYDIQTLLATLDRVVS